MPQPKPDPSDQVLIAQLEHDGLEILPPIEAASVSVPDLVEHAALLHDFRLEEIDLLCARMLHVRARPGQILIAEDHSDNWMMLIFSGTIDVTKRSPRTGESSRLAVVQRGATLGEMSMFDGEPRYASCAAIDTVEVGVLTRAAVAALIREHPAIGAKLLVKLTQLLSQRLRNTSNQLVKLVNAGPMAQRLVIDGESRS